MTEERRAANEDGELVVSKGVRTRDEKLFLASSYRKDVHSGLFWYLSGRWIRDTSAGIDRRLRGGTGSLRTTHSVRFDNRPVVDAVPPDAGDPGEPVLRERERFDSVLATSLVVNF